MSKPIVKREYVQAFAKDYGTRTVNEMRLAKDLERAYSMIEELRDDYALMSNDALTPRAEQVLYEDCATELARILDGVKL